MKISIIAAITVDGKIAKSPKEFPGWTTKSDKKMFASVTKKSGVIIMGSKTFDVIGKALAERLNIVMTRDKNRVSGQKNLIFTSDPAEKIVADLKAKGYKHAFVCGGARINHVFITKELVDELVITFSPLIFGKGISLFSNDAYLNLKLKSVKLIDNNSICATYGVLK